MNVMADLKGLTEEQVRWASRHDWHRSSYPVLGSDWQLWKVIVRDELMPDGMKTFDDFKELRVWAGY